MASSSSVSHDNARQTLVDRLLDAVKQCQIRFGGKTELATDGDSRVSCLCVQWEVALQFGIKSNRKLNPLRHVAGQVLLKPESESALWQFLKGHLSPTEIHQFNSLQNISTDVGRARAWLRSALNEQSLEKYLHCFLGNTQLLSSYFEQEALLMDEERSSMLPMMAAGLSSILFAINIDNSEFNTSKQSSSSIGLDIHIAPATMVSDSTKHPPSPTYSSIQNKEKKKRKKKKTSVAVASIENVDFEENYEVKMAHNKEDEREEISVNNFTRIDSEKSTKATQSNSTNQVYRTSQYSNVSNEGNNGQTCNRSVDVANEEFKEYGVLQNDANIDRLLDGTDTNSSSQKTQKTVSNLSEQRSPLGLNLESGIVQKVYTFQTNRQPSDIDTAAGEGTEEEPLVELSSGVSLTPVSCPNEAMLWALQDWDDECPGGSEGGVDGSSTVSLKLFPGLTRDSPVSSGFTTDDEVNEDANLAIDATEAALSAVMDVQKEMADYTRFVVRTMGDGRNSPPKQTTKEMTSDELKQAIVSMMLRKDEVEECNRSLRQLLDKEMLESASLRLQVEELTNDKVSSREAHHTTAQALSSENDLLKHQLKKYVAAVQSLRRNGPLDIAVPGILQNDGDLPVLPERNNLNNCDNKDMEDEFERKLVQVADMHGELIELNERLQKMLNIREHQLRRLREELVNLRGPLPDDANQDDSLSLDELGPRLVPVNTRSLINIWIPSAFAQGKSSNIHHTYQVYVRIKDDEWNIYRRYSHFHAMHNKISKQYPAISNFKFPQKKVIGNRDARFVEIRRRHLQSYLRKLINYGLKTIPELSENPSKNTLVECFPFFSNSSKENKVTTPENKTQTHYTGL